MNSAHDIVGDPGGPTPHQPLASWYTHGASDGLGDRLLMFDNTAAASLELVRFRPKFAEARGFERALRDRVERLAPFSHPAFSQARAVQRLDGDEGLALVSTHTPGRRLSEIFQEPQARAGIHPAFAVWLIRQVTTALTDLHAQGAGIAHGALAADRIVLTPDSRLVIVEHVMGSALDELQLSAHQLWHDLGIVAVPGLSGSLRLDGRGDVVQLGLVALSILVGRRITPEEYPARLAPLLDEFSKRAEQRSPSLVPPLRHWLTRALQIQDRGFGSALEAKDGLRELPDLDGPQALEQLPTSHPRAIRSLPETSMSNTPVPIPEKPVPAAEPSTDQPWEGLEEAAVTPYDTLAARVRQEAASAVAPGAAKPVKKRPPPPDRPARVYRPVLTARNLAAAFAVVSLVEAAAIGRLLTTRIPVSAGTANVRAGAANLPVTIESPESGDVVIVDGRQVGVTPLELTVSASTRSIRVLSRPAPPAVSAPTVAAPARIADALAKKDAPAASAPAREAARPISGGLRLSTPIEIQVLEGEHVLGSSATGPIVISAGTHQLDFINSAFGYRSRQTVQIKAGQILPLRVQPPDGRISINALPWAQVWIDGNPVGETPLANLPVAVGEHEIIFRHPQFGERRETTIVKSDTLTRVSATLGR